MAFIYTPLPDASQRIRLFSIAPGKEGSVIRIVLHGDYRLGYQECPSYAALSYAWGPPSPSYTIELNKTQIQVRENLWMFLSQLRRSGDHRRLWSDALCIDQNNVVEKNAQVNIMDRIYLNAEVVVVWLGDESDGSDSVMEMANTAHTINLSSLDWMDARLNAPSIDVDDIPALYSLCTRPYWARTWILQELYLTRRDVIVLCGLKETTLSKLQILLKKTMEDSIIEREACQLISRPGKKVPDFWNTLSTCTLRWLSTKKPKHQTYLEDLLTKHKSSLCSDPRDRIYALQNMTANSHVPVDYSMDLCELYWTVLARCYSSDLRFGQGVQEALGLTTLAIRDCAAIGPYEDTRPILSGGGLLRSAPTTPLTRLGKISTIEKLLADDTRNEASSKMNVRFSSTISPSRDATLRLYTGIASNLVQPGDVVYRLTEIPEILVILRWIAISRSQKLRGTGRETSLSDCLSNRTFYCFGVAAENLDSDQMALFSQVLSRMNLTSTRLATKGIRPIYPCDAISAWGSRGDPCLVLNRAALVAFLEYFDGHKGRHLR